MGRFGVDAGLTRKDYRWNGFDVIHRRPFSSKTSWSSAGMQIASSPEITNRNIALVLLCTGTFRAFKPFTKLLNLASSFHCSLRPASIELNGPARIGSSKATCPLNFGLATSSQLLGRSAGLIFLVL